VSKIQGSYSSEKIKKERLVVHIGFSKKVISDL
jgi:hypothetical protein